MRSSRRARRSRRHGTHAWNIGYSSLIGGGGSSNQTVAGAVAALMLAGSSPLVTTSSPWQLATGHYQPAYLVPVIVHPRPDVDTGSLASGNPNSWERARLAPDGIPWRVPITVYGGAWPFEYKLLSGPSGMSVGQHYGDTDYGFLSWASPVIGTYTIQVQVTTQDFGRTSGSADPTGQYTVSWTLVVADHTDVTKFVYLDASAGNNANNGAFATPWQTLAGFAAASTSGKQLIFKAGTYAMNALSAVLDCTSRAKVFIGYPGASVTIDYSGSWSGTDIWILMNSGTSGGCSASNITFSGSPSNWATINSGSNHDQFHIFHYGDRALYFENTFTGLNGYSTNGNWSNWQGIFPAATATMHNYFSCEKNAFSNMSNMESGGAFISYSMRCAVIEGNSVTGFNNGKNVQQGIITKGHNSLVSTRANFVWVQGGTLASPVQGITTGGIIQYQGPDGGQGDNPDKNESCWNLTFNIPGPNGGVSPAALVTGDASFAAWTCYEYRNTSVGPRIAAGASAATNILYSSSNLLLTEHGIENDWSHYGATNLTLNVSGDIVDTYANRVSIVDATTGYILSAYAAAHGITIGTVGHQVS